MNNLKYKNISHNLYFIFYIFMKKIILDYFDVRLSIIITKN